MIWLYLYPIVLGILVLFEIEEAVQALRGKKATPKLWSYHEMPETERARYDPRRVQKVQAANCLVFACICGLLLVLEIEYFAPWEAPVSVALGVAGGAMVFLNTVWALDLFCRKPDPTRLFRRRWKR